MITRIRQVVLPLTFMVGVGFTFTPLGCGSSIPPAVPMADDGNLARQLRSCAEEHERHLGSTSHAMSFDVHLTDDGNVDSVALRDETLRDDGLETCMAHALRSLTVDDLPMRLSGSGRPGAVAPESRGLLGQTPIEAVALEACLASPPCALSFGLFIGAAFIAVTVYIHMAANSTLVHSQAKTLAASRSKSACIDMFVVCQEIAGICLRVGTRGHTVCRACQIECQAGNPYTTNECYRCGFQ